MMDNNSDNKIVIPTNNERGYSSGWQAYHAGRELNSNPHNPDDDSELYEGFLDGWVSAQMEDNPDD